MWLAKIVPLRLPDDSILRIVREAAKESENIVLLDNLVYPQIIGAPGKHIFGCLRSGELVDEDPTVDQHGNYIIRLQRIAAAIACSIDVAIEEKKGQGEYRLIVLNVEFAVIF